MQMRIRKTGEVIEILCGYFSCDLNGSPSVRDAHGCPCKKDVLSTSIRQIFNGREQNDLYGMLCAREAQLGGRPKGVWTTDGVTTTRTT